MTMEKAEANNANEADNSNVPPGEPANSQSGNNTSSSHAGIVPPAANCKKPRPDLGSLTTRQYLDQTVSPILLRGLQILARERPSDPVSFLAAFLLKNKSCLSEVTATENN